MNFKAHAQYSACSKWNKTHRAWISFRPAQKHLISAYCACVKEDFPQVPLVTADTYRQTWFSWIFTAASKRHFNGNSAERHLCPGCHLIPLFCSVKWLPFITTKQLRCDFSTLLSLFPLFSTLILCSLSFAVLGGARARPKCPTQRYHHFPCFFSLNASLPFCSRCYPLSHTGPKSTKQLIVLDDYKNMQWKWWFYWFVWV